MNPWKALVVKHKAKSVKPIPEGWLTRAQVAEKIGCAESRVNENLRSALKAKDVLIQKFPIWDAIEGKIVSIPCYSLRKAKESESTRPKKENGLFPEGTKVRRKDGSRVGVVVSGGNVKWSDGRVTTPSGSTLRKLVRV
jgi:hypothetical protein